MSTDSSSDTPLDIQGYITDPKMSGYQMLTNYENTYWRALVGNAAWSLYEVLRGFCHQQQNTCRPSINLLIGILGLEQRRVLTGWSTKVKGKTYKYPGLIEILQEHKLVVAEVKGAGPKMHYVFHVNLNPRLLTDQQLASLPPLLQKKHQELIKRCQERMRELEAKRRPPKVQLDSDHSGDQKETKGSDNLSEGMTNCQRGSDNLSPKQQPITIPNITTGTRARINNNSSGSDDDKQDVVVALGQQGIAEKVAHRLTERYSRERIFEKIEFLAYLRECAPEQVKKPQGWLRRAIEENYSAPDGYKSQAQRDAEATAQQRQEEEMQQAEAAEQRREEEEHERQQQEEVAWHTHLEQTYGTTQRELDLWCQCLDEFKATMPAATFQSCMADTLLLSLQDGEALIGLPNPGVRDWVENRLTRKIGRILSSYSGAQKVTVKFIDLDGAGTRTGTA